MTFLEIEETKSLQITDFVLPVTLPHVRTARNQNDSTGQLSAYIVRYPRAYLRVARVLVTHLFIKARLFWLCWRNGHVVREVRTMARSARGKT